MPTLRRSADGLGLLGLLAAAAIPVFAVIASVHRAHWMGVSGAGFFEDLLMPWSGRVWAGVLLLAVAGWASGAAPDEPGRGRRMALGAALGASAAGLCLLAALPAWVWLMRLGGEGAPGRAIVAGLVPLVGGAVAGFVGPALGEAAGATAGAAVGGAALWLVWGVFG